MGQSPSATTPGGDVEVGPKPPRTNLVPVALFKGIFFDIFFSFVTMIYKKKKMSQQTYFLLPHVAIEQQPPPFTWTENFQEQCDAAQADCAGYTSDGKAFDNSAFNVNMSKMKVNDEAEKGSYFKDKALFAFACDKLKGQMQGDKCELNALTARNTVRVMENSDKVEGFHATYRRRRQHSLFYLALNVLLITGIVLVVVFASDRRRR